MRTTAEHVEAVHLRNSERAVHAVLTYLADPAEHWMDDALCAQMGDPDLFFPDKGGSVREAKRICGMCPVATECLQYALDNGEAYGIYGGVTERERRKLPGDTRARVNRQHADAADRDTEVLALVAKGWTHTDIARHLGINRKAANSRVKRARRRSEDIA